MTHFYALDVETANMDMASICQIGIVEFRDGEVISQWGTYIDPEDYFDPFNIDIHGITPKMVTGAPLFPDTGDHLRKIASQGVVVTHTPFDQRSIELACAKYDLPPIKFTWLDSARVVRRQWEQFRHAGYALQNISKFLGIKYKSHDALDDARAAGEVMLRVVEESHQPLEEWLERAYRRITQDSSFACDGDPDGPFYGETIVFTGALSIPRREAAHLAAEVGCNVGDGVTKETTVLVVGIQNKDILAGYDKSSKHRKAEMLIAQGQQIRIISETDFLSMI